MPQRPRQHQIEDRSRTAFRSALPERWVFRDSVPDYGIDGEVEVFGEDNRATGKLFKVQLKATDKSPLSAALAISLQIETCNYYRALDMPTLIVRYHVPSSQIFIRWFHTFDPYYARKGKKTVTFKLTPSDKWSVDTASRLDADLSIIRQIKHGQIPIPICVVESAQEKKIHGIPADQIMSSLREAAGEISGSLRFTVSAPSDPYIKLRVGNDMTEVDLNGVKTFTYHTRGRYPKALASSHFHFDVMVLISLVLSRTNNFYAASRIIERFAERSHIARDSKIVFELTMCLVRAHRISEALKLSETLLDRSGSELSGQIAFIATFMNKESLSRQEFEDLLDFLRRRVAWSEKIGDSRLIATAHYNLANAIRGKSRRFAVHHFHKAYELDPTYGKREYFWREIGGVFFESRRYRLATEFYIRALKSRKEHRGLFADALMMTGKYKEAQQVFDSHLRTTSGKGGRWSCESKLKRWALNELRVRMGFDEQRRDPSLSGKRLPKHISYSDQDKKDIEAALGIDALNWIAWEDLGCIAMKAGKPSDAVLPFMMTALLRRHVGGWMNALMACIASRQHWPLVQDIIGTAYLIQGEHFFKQVVSLSSSQQQDEGKSLIDLVKEAIKSLPEDGPRAPTVRILGRGAKYTVLGSHSSNSGSVKSSKASRVRRIKRHH